MKEFEFNVEPIGEHDLAPKDKQHKLEFSTLYGPTSRSTNVQFLTDDELRDVHSQIDAYLAGLR